MSKCKRHNSPFSSVGFIKYIFAFNGLRVMVRRTDTLLYICRLYPPGAEEEKERVYVE